MFDDTIISILGNEPKNTPSKSVLADVQEFNGEIELDNFKFNVYKRLYIDYLEPLIQVNTHIKIDNEVLKVVKVNKYSDYLEVFVKEIKDVEINGIDKSVIIEDSPDKIIDYKTIITGFTISSGDLIEHQSEKWLLIGEVEQGKNSYRGTIRKIQHFIKVKFADGIYNMPSIIEDKIQNTQDGKVLSLVDGKIEILTQLNSISKKIRYNWNFITMGNKWEVEGFSYCNKGLYKIYARKTEYNKDTDDMENGISNNPESKDIYMNDNYILEVNLDNNSLKMGETKQINVVCKKNGIEDKTPIVTYKSNNENVVTVNSTGLITAKSEGVTTINIIYNNVEKVITININKIVYNLEVITTDSKLKTNETLQIQTKCTVDNNEDLNPHREYSSNNENIATVNEIGLVTAIAEGNSTITVKYQDIIKTINIEVKNAVDPPRLELISEDGEFNVNSLFDKTFTAKYFVNGIEDKTAKFTFTLENKIKYDNRHRLLPQLATIKSFTDNSCILKANNKAQYGIVVLSVSLSDNSLSISKEIMVKNPFA